MWHSGDEDGLQSQRSGVQIQVQNNRKKLGGVRSSDRDGVRVKGVNRVRDRDRVRAFGDTPSPPLLQKSGEITYLEKTKLTSFKNKIT